MNQIAKNTEVAVRKGDQLPKVVCPKCDSTALNKYGRVKSGKQRFLCLACNRQFCWPSSIKPIPFRPKCPKCSKPMHVYMRKYKKIRFRCSDYPNCKQYTIIGLKA